jgi:hypothetical protein
MTRTQEWIAKYLKGRGWCGPTQIGNAYGDSKYGNNSFHSFDSAWASPRCKALVEAGVLERNNHGHYRLVSGNLHHDEVLQRNQTT